MTTAPFATRPCAAWDTTAVSFPLATTGVAYLRVAKDRSVNYISSLQAGNALRPDHGAAKQAAPPRGIPR